jgi:hypothetical protein
MHDRSYGSEEKAARAHDLAILKLHHDHYYAASSAGSRHMYSQGVGAPPVPPVPPTNFPAHQYAHGLRTFAHLTGDMEEF